MMILSVCFSQIQFSSIIYVSNSVIVKTLNKLHLVTTFFMPYLVAE